MGDIIVSIVAKIAEYAVGPILHHARYLCCFNNFAGSLSTAKEELELTRDSVKERAREATNRTEKIEPIVEKWLKEVEKVLDEVQQLERRISEVSKSCLRRRCQYFLAKEIARITEKMTQFNRNSRFESFSRTTELPGMKFYSSKGFILFKSTETAYNKLLEELKDKSVFRVALVGLGGSGKTTLAKEVGKKAEEFKLFEKVVMATISQTPNIRRIQAQIADQLGVPFREESDEGRAQRLSRRLSECTTLLILDDVWQKLDFEALGIPFNEISKSCVVLITSRSRRVCTSMQCESIIDLNLLTGEEGLTLFKSYANIIDDRVDSGEDVARKIVDKCEGLPIAIVAVGSTLREKSLKDWRLALSRLEDSKPLDVPEGLRCPYDCLQLSYDNLTNQLAKSLFLSCSIFPEDHEIDLEDLFRFGRGLGLTETYETLEKARMEMQIAVNLLMDSCLLLQASDENKVKMHDMVRDVALWIASERGQAILASTAMDPRMSLENESIKDKKAISLWDLKNGHLPIDQLNCPALEILLLHSQWVGFKVSNAFLERLKMLKILAFITCDYSWQIYWPYTSLSLPQSIELLRNLHTLCLRGYKLGDISILEKLEALEILDLRGSSFEELPSGIAALKKLKLLDLYKCRIEKKNALEVTGRCLQLEELYLCLGAEVFPHNVSFPRLQRYVIIQHYFESHLKKYRPSRALSLAGFNASAQSFMSLPIKDLFLKVEYLHLEYLQGGYKNVIPSMYPQGLNQLIVLVLEYCGEIECLIDSVTNVDMLQPETAFSSLATLKLNDLNSLKEVFPRNSKLCSLKELEIYNCSKLTCIFMPSIAQTLVLLESLTVYGCSELKNVIEEGDVDEYVSSQSHTSLMLPKLRSIEIIKCDKLEYIFPICIARKLVSLETLSIDRNREMKYVFGSEKEQQSQHQTNIDLHLLNLDFLSLKSLPNLVHIWYRSHLSKDVTAMEKVILWAVAATSNQLKGLLKIRSIFLYDVGVKGVFQFQIGEPISNTQFVPFNLQLSYLSLYNLPELNFIWKGPTNFLCLQMLGRIWVEKCPKLTTIFSPTIVRSFPKLSYLTISNCEELEQIFELKSLYTCSQQVCFPQLDSITVQNCNKLKCLFYNFMAGHFPSLRELRIYRCSQLERVFAFEREADDVGQEGTGKDGQQVFFISSKLENLNDIMLTSLPSFKEIHHGFELRHMSNIP